ncbi:hypothetical protein Ancab_014404 [Ancistrocladus abbreviatus]
MGRNGGNFDRSGRRFHGRDIESSVGEGGRNIQIDIGGDDLNISTGRGSRGRGGNRGRGGGGVRSRRGGGSNINSCKRLLVAAIPELLQEVASCCNTCSNSCKRLLVAAVPEELQEVASCCNTCCNSCKRANLEDVVQKYVLLAVLTLLQITKLFKTEAAYMWTSFAAFLVYCMLLILNNSTILVGQLKLVFGSLALVASLSIVIPSKLRHFALIIWAILVILIIAHHMLKKSYQWIHCAAKQIIRRMMCMVQRPEQAQSRGLPI